MSYRPADLASKFWAKVAVGLDDERWNCKACARRYWREIYYPKLKERNYYGKRSSCAANL